MWQELTTLWTSVRDPEYAHLLLESVPLYGLAFGVTFLVVAMVAGEGRSRLLALVVICVSCASVWPYVDLRRKATPRIIATRDAGYYQLIQEQTARRSDTASLFYLMTGVSGLAIVFGRKGRGQPLIFMTVLGAAGLFWFSIWLHKKECEVYHRNIIRYVAPG